jgi:hypothetical protein
MAGQLGCNGGDSSKKELGTRELDFDVEVASDRRRKDQNT